MTMAWSGRSESVLQAKALPSAVNVDFAGSEEVERQHPLQGRGIFKADAP
jgi:hypothetical protein